MGVIKTGNKYEIYNDELSLYEKLPPQNYVVRFHKNCGFYLEEHNAFFINENKIYGEQDAKMEKVLKSFERTERNLGVILSGDKGIGKSLFAKMVCIQSVRRGIPVIVVDTYYQGIAHYLEGIKQEVVVLFDEFDKTFFESECREEEGSPQMQLLTLFDGISSGKKLFVITCNQVSDLNEYLINRPGRFHYHFRFEYPSANEVREYLKDNLEKETYGEIEEVIAFSSRVALNYDCLRAIVFEMNQGRSFKESIKDLNILNVDCEHYNVSIYFNNGERIVARGIRIDFFSNEMTESIYMYNKKGDFVFSFNFNPRDYYFDSSRLETVINPDKIILNHCEEDRSKNYNKEKIKYVSFVREEENKLHYQIS